MSITSPLIINKVFENPDIWHVVGLVQLRNRRTEIIQVEGPHLSACIYRVERLLRGVESGTQELIQTSNGTTSNTYISADLKTDSKYKYPYKKNVENIIDNNNNINVEANKNQIEENQIKENQIEENQENDSEKEITLEEYYENKANKIKEKAKKQGFELSYTTRDIFIK